MIRLPGIWFLIITFVGALNLGFAQSNQRFQATANAADVITPVGGKGVIGLGFYAESVYPISSVFSALTKTGKGTEEMRFQVPVGFGIETSYGITRKIEAALSIGYDNFKTQQLIEDSGGAIKTFNIAKFQLFPLMLVGRYRLPKKGWSPEAEAAFGAAFGSIEVRETTLGGKSFTQSGPFYRGHVAVGPGFSWAEGASLHFQVGYGFNRLGNRTYENIATGMKVTQNGNMHGVFTKAFLKFYF